jgi:hypothetical protein
VRCNYLRLCAGADPLGLDITSDGDSTTDSIVFIGVSVVIAHVVLAACYVPALTATKADPMIAMRID